VTDVFDFSPGRTPLLVSIPHDGRHLPPDIAARMTDTGRAIPDTDWHVIRLYDFARALGASVIAANCSRYVVDLNRSASDEPLYPGQLSTGLCPTASFGGDALYRAGQAPTGDEKNTRVRDYWRPYHDKLAAELAAIKSRFGYALLWDAHSIPGEVPLLFDGVLPDLNVGTNGGRSCAPGMDQVVFDVARRSDYSAVLNGRFKGGFITRHYGSPGDDVHAIQLELTQRCYMDERTLDYAGDAASRLAGVIRTMLLAFIAAAEDVYGK
jgi:N-formylglutamate deformylase